MTTAKFVQISAAICLVEGEFSSTVEERLWALDDSGVIFELVQTDKTDYWRELPRHPTEPK